MIDNVINVPEKFKASTVKYEVSIVVEIKPKLLLAIALCLIKRVNLTINHTFNEYPFVVTKK